MNAKEGLPVDKIGSSSFFVPHRQKNSSSVEDLLMIYQTISSIFMYTC